jgi:hypothetical protein
VPLLPFAGKCCLCLTFDIVALLEPLDTPGGIHHAALTGKKRMTVAAYFNFEFFFCRTGGESIAAGTYYRGIIIIFRMYLLFHIIQLL